MNAPASPLVRRFARNPVGRDLVVGDIHGCFSKLAAALEAVGFNPAADRLFALGDLVDRGSESDQALWWLAQPWFFSIRGNHEAAAVMFAEGSLPTGYYAQFGGAWLIAMTPPERVAFRDALGDLPVAIELETEAGLLGLVHAKCPTASWQEFVALLGRPPSPAMDGLLQVALWSHARLVSDQEDDVAGVRAVLVGHTPVRRLTSLGNVHYLDCGAWKGHPAGSDPQRPFVIVDAATLRPAAAPSALDWGQPQAGWGDHSPV